MRPLALGRAAVGRLHPAATLAQAVTKLAHVDGAVGACDDGSVYVWRL